MSLWLWFVTFSLGCVFVCLVLFCVVNRVETGMFSFVVVRHWWAGFGVPSCSVFGVLFALFSLATTLFISLQFMKIAGVDYNTLVMTRQSGADYVSVFNNKPHLL